MKITTQPTQTKRSLPLAIAAAMALASSASALTIPVSQDTNSLPTGKIAAATGGAPTLAVNSKQTALLRFNLNNNLVLPQSIKNGDIKSVTLRLYVTSVKFPANIVVRAVSSDWQERFVGAPVLLPTIIPGSVSAIPQADLVAKKFVEVDLTDYLMWAVETGNDFGVALQTTDPKTKLTFSSKEGPATGYPAELEIVANTDTFVASSQIRLGNTFRVDAAEGSTGSFNFFGGEMAGSDNTTGSMNTFLGSLAGQKNTAGDDNTFIGGSAGVQNTASENTFIGSSSGLNNTTGAGNTYVGFATGATNSTGEKNCFMGSEAGRLNTSSNNSFFGAGAGRNNTGGTQNAFFGTNAGLNSTGNFNSFFGSAAGQATTNGLRNVAVGKSAGIANTTGTSNTFLGAFTGGSMSTESNNTFIGDSANGAAGITNATAIGWGANVAISNAVVLGSGCNVGIKTVAPHSALHVNGSISLPIRTSNVALTALDEDDYVLVNTANNAGVQLPTAVGIIGRVYVIKNRAGTALTLGTSPSTQTIDGTTTISIPANGSAQIISNGGNWIKIN